jgi:hypothetical protein
MLCQVRTLQELIGHRQQPDALLLHFNELSYAIDTPCVTNSIAHSLNGCDLIALYGRYVREWLQVIPGYVGYSDGADDLIRDISDGEVAV